MFLINEAKNRRLFLLFFLIIYGQTATSKEKTIAFTEPYNVTGFCLLDKIHFLKSFISEKPDDLEAFARSHETIVSNLKLVDAKNPYKAYFLSETYTHKAMLNFKTGNHYTAALALKEAHNWLKQNQKNHPSFLPTFKNLALFETAAAHLTEGYSWILKIVGVNTEYNKSLSIAEKFTQSSFTNEWEIFRKETAFTLAYIHRQFLHDSKSLEIIKANTLDYAVNPLSLYFLSTFSYKSGLNDAALRYINALSPQENQIQIPFLHYLKGLCLLNKLDPSSYTSFNTYLQLYKGDNYVKSCHLKMAWSKLLINDITGYQNSISKIITQGKSITEEDKQAITEFNRKEIPNLILLKSRLLFDGGYYKKSLKLIMGVKASDFSSPLLQTEYCYRKARIYDVLGEQELAIAFYEAAISTGKYLNAYYSAYSCIYLGDIYTLQNEKQKAREYYALAMTFKKNEEYRNSIEQHAKRGLRKL